MDAGTAWQRIRAGEAAPATFGLDLPDGIMSGENFAEARKTCLQEDRLRIPRTVLSLAPFNGPREVTLRELR